MCWPRRIFCEMDGFTNGLMESSLNTIVAHFYTGKFKQKAARITADVYIHATVWSEQKTTENNCRSRK